MAPRRRHRVAAAGPGGPAPVRGRRRWRRRAGLAPAADGQRPNPRRFAGAWTRCRPRRPAPCRCFADYATVDGVKFPKQISAAVDGKPAEEWTIEKIKVNPALKADFFDKK